MTTTSDEVASHYDVVIVGSGHNGLVAAAYLAGAGLSVLVLEKNATLGGATASSRVFPGYDALLSRYSYLVSLFPSLIIEELGLDFQTRRRRTASFTPYRDSLGTPRGLVLSNEDEGRSCASMRELTGNDAAWNDYRRLLELESALARIIWPSLLQPLQARSDFHNALANDDEREAWRAFVERPLGETIERYAQHDVLRGLLMTDGKIGVLTYPHDVTLLQNRCFLYHVIGNGTGEWQVPVGGMQSLVTSLVSRCQASHVTFMTRAAATGVQCGPRLHTVHFESDEREFHVDASRVLINAGPRTFANLLGETWVPESSDEGSVVKINMLLKRLPRVRAVGVSSEEAFSGSLHIDEGYEQMLQSFQQAANGELPNPAPGEIYCHTLTDSSILSPDLRAQGYHTLTLFGLDMPYRLFTSDHNARRERVKELYLEGLDRICAEPFRDCLAVDREGRPCLEIMTPQELEREIDLDLGNIFHNTLSWFFADDPRQVGRWGVETHHSRVYRAGSSAMRGGAVSGIPGRNAAMAVLEEIGHRK